MKIYFPRNLAVGVAEPSGYHIEGNALFGHKCDMCMSHEMGSDFFAK